MTTMHGRPGRLRLLTLAGAVLLGGTLAAQGQPKPSDVSRAQASGRPITSHDDPIVIDNAPIFIHRAQGVLNPRKDPQAEWWSFHEMAPFTHIRVTSWHRDTHEQQTPIQLSLSPDADVMFQLIKPAGGKTDESFEVRQEVIAEDPDHRLAIATSTNYKLGFKRSSRKITPKPSTEFHVGQIQFGDTYVCVSDTPAPTQEPCRRWDYVPWKVQVMLCANLGCKATERSKR